MKYRFTNEEVKNLLYDYNSMKDNFPKDKPKSVEIWDETLRDGEQSPSVYLTKNEKIEIARALDEIGVSLIAVGFPVVSELELNTVKAIVHQGFNHSTILGIARPKESDINACLKADLDEIVLFMPISRLMMKVLRKTPQEEYDLIEKMMLYAKDHGLKVNWVSEDASRADPDHLLKIFDVVVKNGAKRIVLTDTVGILNPRSVAFITKLVKEKILKDHPDIGLGIHAHNDFGLAVANTLEAVFNGATFPHTCVNGYGERSGNAALEEVVMCLEQNNIKTGIKLEKLPELSRLVEKHFCLPLAAHKPIVGDFCFSHESGLHINAILSHPMSYEPFPPKLIGRTRKFFLGKFSGSGAIRSSLSERLKLIDINFPPDILRKITLAVKSKQESTSKEEKKHLFKEIKENLSRISAGVTDTEYYKIIREAAGAQLNKYLEKNRMLMEDLEKNLGKNGTYELKK
ncbi:MAG: LeuA family protein [Promethearchaeota archaeon]